MVIHEDGNLLQTIERLAREQDPFDCQVIVAVNDKSALSRKQVNLRLQELLNPKRRLHGSPFADGDKVICTANGRYTLIDRRYGTPGSEVYVANGEIGKVAKVEPKLLIIDLWIPTDEFGFLAANRLMVKAVAILTSPTPSPDTSHKGRSLRPSSSPLIVTRCETCL